MVDAKKMAVEWLLGDAALVGILGGNFVFGGNLPAGWDPSSGTAVVVTGAGGKAHPEIPPIQSPRLQVRVWAGPDRFADANEAYAAVYDLMHGANNVPLDSGFVMSSIEATQPQDLVDPDTGWASVLAFYQLMIR